LAVSSIVVLLICAVLTSAAPLFSPQPGIVLLKNGQIIAGSILREGDRYVVTLGARGDQGELKIPLAEVDCVCKTLDEAYLHKRDSILQNGVKPHTDLAEWCIRQGLLDRAADELVVAMKIDPSDGKIAAVERRLKFAAEPKAEKKKPRPAFVLPPSQEEIEGVLRTLPADAIEEFTANVQPLLLNRCAATACHGPNSDANFHLVRPPLRHANKTRETQRNLFAALSQISHEGDSPLLATPLAPHGGSDAPVLDHHDRRQIEQLAAWIARVKSSSGSDAKVEKTDRGVRRANFEEDMPSTPRRLPGVEEPAEFEPEQNAQPLKPGAAGKAGARDPFDPKVFNERYHPPKK
jgi:hypothetical protein